MSLWAAQAVAQQAMAEGVAAISDAATLNAQLRARGLALGGERTQRLSHPVAQLIEQRFGAGQPPPLVLPIPQSDLPSSNATGSPR